MEGRYFLTLAPQVSPRVRFSSAGLSFNRYATFTVRLRAGKGLKALLLL